MIAHDSLGACLVRNAIGPTCVVQQTEIEIGFTPSCVNSLVAFS